MPHRIHIPSIHKDGIIEALRHSWKVTPEAQPHLKTLQIPSHLGTGCIKEFRFDAGVYLILFKGCLQEPMKISVQTRKKTPILFEYQVSGDVYLNLYGDETERHKVPELDMTIHAPYGSDEVVYEWDAGQAQEWVLVAINRSVYQTHLEHSTLSLPSRLGQLFRGGPERNSFFYQKPYGIYISKVLAEMSANTFDPGLLEAFMEGKTLELLALQFHKYLDTTEPSKRIVDLKPHDLNAIVKARELIDASLHDAPTIPELARKVGVNVNKLKRGFKQVYNTTINRYTTGKRLDWANQLLLKEDMPVGEVVYRVGYENRSYFSRIYKERFGMHPSDARKQLQVSIPEQDQA